MVGLVLSSCSAYKQNIMFKTADEQAFRQQLQKAETNYTIRRDDLLSLEVYTNKGEKIVDPNQESFDETSKNQTATQRPEYLVDANGLARFPMIDEIKLEGLTLRQAEQILQKAYSQFYQEPFVMLKFMNKRVTVLGSGDGQVVPLTNENTKLTEVLALSKSITTQAKAYNIRVIREDKTFIADLSTLEGYLQNDIVVMPGDIIYVEPVRRPFSEGIREYGPVISVITSVGTLIIVILQINK